MNFKIGQKVAALDEDISGTITKIEGDIITIETSEGFDLAFKSKELIVSKSFSREIFSTRGIEEVIKEKESLKRKQVTSVKPKDRNLPAMEVDLHIHKLTTSEKNMTSHSKLNLQVDTAKRQLEFAMKKRIQKIVFIHGKGEGVLRLELETLFRRYDNLKYYDADLQKYGSGATEVYIFQNINP